MPSSNVTCPGNSALEIVTDATLRTATLNRFGGTLINFNTSDVVVNVEGAPINSVTPGSLDPGSIMLKAATAGAPPIPVKLPMTCQKFTFKSAALSSIQYTPDGGA